MTTPASQPIYAEPVNVTWDKVTVRYGDGTTETMTLAEYLRRCDVTMTSADGGVYVKTDDLKPERA